MWDHGVADAAEGFDRDGYEAMLAGERMLLERPLSPSPVAKPKPNQKNTRKEEAEQ